MNRLFLPLLLLATLLTTACASLEDYDNTTAGNFDVLWREVDEHYCYFREKDIDWDGVRSIYRPRALACRTDADFFNTCAAMLDTLRDGHVNLSSTFNTSYYRKWWTDYPQDFNLRTLQQYYLDFDYNTAGGFIYKRLANDKIGYIYYSSFSSGVGESNLDAVLTHFADCDAIILDIRNNGGGLVSNVETLVSRFIESDYTAGYILHKTGPGHDDFSEPYPLTYHPAEGRVRWAGPVYLLTNRSCFSAANDFASAMKQLPNVTVIGARTGGGGGMPFSSQLPCGWRVRFSACPMTDAAGNDIESGIDPDIEVHSPDAELAAGKDAILETAIAAAMK